MRWKIGFFRIWIVLSVLYILGVSLLAFEKVQSEFSKATERAAWANLGIPLLPVDCAQARGKANTDYEQTWRPEINNGRNVCMYQLPRFRSLFPEYKELTDSEVSRRLYAKVKWPVTEDPQPWSTLGNVLWFAILPPIALLVFGMSLAWALSGFRAKT